MLHDFRYALRALRRNPGFTVVAVLCLAVGMGATTTMVEAVDLLLLRPPPLVRAPRELREIQIDVVTPGAPAHSAFFGMQGVTYADYLGLRADLRGLRSVAGYAPAELSLGRGAAARPVTVAFVTSTFFPLLGVQPAMGRPITADGVDGIGDPAPAMISYALWQAQFAGESSIIGRTIQIGNGTYVIVGVTPRGFRGLELLKPTDVWVPIGGAIQEMFGGNTESFVRHSEGLVRVVGRLSPGASPQQVAKQAANLEQRAFAQRFARMDNARTVATLIPIVAGVRDPSTRDAAVALWLTAVAAIVLLIACANVAGLLLVRAVDRRREVAIRVALGGTRAQIARLFLIEGLILASAGGVLGLIFRHWGGAVIRVLLFPHLDVPYSAWDARILAFSTLLTCATGIACGLAPALHFRGREIAREVSGAPHAGRLRPPRVRAVLLSGQVALATALVIAAALFVSSWWNVRTIRLGFATDHLLVGRMSLDAMNYTMAETRSAYDRMRDRVSVLPGVRSVSLVSRLPFVNTVDDPGNPTSIPGVDPDVLRRAGHLPLGPELNAISPSFFATTGTPLQGGRAFDDRDRAGTEAVAIINEKMARTFWPAGTALNKCVTIQWWGTRASPAPCSRIVGIAGDTKTVSIRAEPDLQMYVPLAQRDDQVPDALVVRTQGDAAALVASVRYAMQSTSSGFPFADVRPLASYLEPEMRPWRLGALMCALFGAAALALAAVGLYGVFAYAVSRRAREIGIRGALGAHAGDVLRLVILEGLRLSAAGTVIGIVLAVGMGRLLGTLLVGVAGTSPVVLGGTAAFVLCITLLAVSLPARRAARLDPAVALHAE